MEREGFSLPNVLQKSQSRTPDANTKTIISHYRLQQTDRGSSLWLVLPTPMHQEELIIASQQMFMLDEEDYKSCNPFHGPVRPSFASQGGLNEETDIIRVSQYSSKKRKRKNNNGDDSVTDSTVSTEDMAIMGSQNVIMKKKRKKKKGENIVSFKVTDISQDMKPPSSDSGLLPVNSKIRSKSSELGGHNFSQDSESDVFKSENIRKKKKKNRSMGDGLTPNDIPEPSEGSKADEVRGINFPQDSESDIFNSQNIRKKKKRKKHCDKSMNDGLSPDEFSEPLAGSKSDEVGGINFPQDSESDMCNSQNIGKKKKRKKHCDKSMNDGLSPDEFSGPLAGSKTDEVGGINFLQDYESDMCISQNIRKKKKRKKHCDKSMGDGLTPDEISEPLAGSKTDEVGGINFPQDSELDMFNSQNIGKKKKRKKHCDKSMRDGLTPDEISEPLAGSKSDEIGGINFPQDSESDMCNSQYIRKKTKRKKHCDKRMNDGHTSDEISEPLAGSKTDEVGGINFLQDYESDMCISQNIRKKKKRKKHCDKSMGDGLTPDEISEPLAGCNSDEVCGINFPQDSELDMFISQNIKKKKKRKKNCDMSMNDGLTPDEISEPLAGSKSDEVGGIPEDSETDMCNSQNIRKKKKRKKNGDKGMGDRLIPDESPEPSDGNNIRTSVDSGSKLDEVGGINFSLDSESDIICSQNIRKKIKSKKYSDKSMSDGLTPCLISEGSKSDAVGGINFSQDSESDMFNYHNYQDISWKKKRKKYGDKRIRENYASNKISDPLDVGIMRPPYSIVYTQGDADGDYISNPHMKRIRFTFGDNFTQNTELDILDSQNTSGKKKKNDDKGTIDDALEGVVGMSQDDLTPSSSTLVFAPDDVVSVPIQQPYKRKINFLADDLFQGNEMNILDSQNSSGKKKKNKKRDSMGTTNGDSLDGILRTSQEIFIPNTQILEFELGDVIGDGDLNPSTSNHFGECTPEKFQQHAHTAESDQKVTLEFFSDDIEDLQNQREFFSRRILPERENVPDSCNVSSCSLEVNENVRRKKKKNENKLIGDRRPSEQSIMYRLEGQPLESFPFESMLQVAESISCSPEDTHLTPRKSPKKTRRSSISKEFEHDVPDANDRICDKNELHTPFSHKKIKSKSNSRNDRLEPEGINSATTTRSSRKRIEHNESTSDEDSQNEENIGLDQPTQSTPLQLGQRISESVSCSPEDTHLTPRKSPKKTRRSSISKEFEHDVPDANERICDKNELHTPFSHKKIKSKSNSRNDRLEPEGINSVTTTRSSRKRIELNESKLDEDSQNEENIGLDQPTQSTPLQLDQRISDDKSNNSTEYIEVINELLTKETFSSNDYSAVLNTINELNAPSRDVLKRMSSLNIIIDWDVHSTHQIESKIGRTTGIEFIQMQCLNKEMKKGRYLPSEDKIIKDNWIKFSQEYEFENPQDFFTLRQNNCYLLPQKECFKLVRYLGRGLPHRTLNSIYFRFRRLFEKKEVGRLPSDMKKVFTKHVNLYGKKYTGIKTIMNKNSHDLSGIAGYIASPLKAKSFKPLREKTQLFEAILEVTHSKSYEDLQGKTIDWKKVGDILNVRSESCRKYWTRNLCGYMALKNPVPKNDVCTKIIECLKKMNVDCSAEINWDHLSPSVFDLPPTFLWHAFNDLCYKLNIKYTGDNFKGALEDLSCMQKNSTIGKCKGKMYPCCKYEHSKLLQFNGK